jgi:hypothetical protein
VIPYDPCGRIVDWYHKPYFAWVRPFRDSDVEAKIEWYPARDDAEVLPFDSAFCNLDQQRMDQILPIFCGYKVGEVPFRERPRSFAKANKRPNGPNVCGTREDFEDGAVYNPDLPPEPRDQDGLPVCCHHEGGLVLGGLVATPTSGGLVFGGAVESAIGGPTCAGATVFSVGDHVYHLPQPIPGPGNSDVWFRAGPLVAGNYRLRFNGVPRPPPDFSIWAVWIGTSCATLFGYPGINPPPVDRVYAVPAGNIFCIQLIASFLAPPFETPVYDFQLDAVP